MSKLGLFLFLFLIGCTSQKNEQTVYRVEVDQIAGEQQIPKAILQSLDREFEEEFKTTPPLYSFLPLNVGLIEAQSGVLLKPYIEYLFPKGGGALDLKDIIKDEGSFYLFFPEEQFVKENELLHLFYVSQSPVVEIDGENFGLGCGKWNDLKDSFKSLQKKDYLKLNTTGQRYLHVLAGTYVFVFKNGKNIFLSQLTLTDSRYANKLCEVTP